LIHNRAYEDLRRLLYFVLQILEAERQTLRHPTTRLASRGRAQSANEGSVADALERLALKAAPPTKSELLKLALRSRESVDRREALHRRFLEGYSELAALGQAAIGISRAVRPQLELLRQLGSRIRDEALRPRRRSTLDVVDQFARTIDVVVDRLAMVAPMETSANHRRRTLDVISELSAFRELMQPPLRAAGVEMEIIADSACVARTEMRPETFHRLLYILAMNSLDWLHGIRLPRIRLKASCSEQHIELVFSDNGPGIPAALADRVFEPLFSCKEGGHGMGLTIARSIVTVHGGEIRVLTDARRRGANISILLPRKRSRATVQ